MDLLEKVISQATELVKNLTPRAKVAAVVVVVVALVCAGSLVRQEISGDDVYLMGGETFAPSQLRDMQAALGQAGLEAQVDGGRVRVPRGQESKYMAALAEGHALPVDFGGYLNKALNSGSVMPLFRSQQEAALKLAKQQELQLIIGHMRGIEKAAVQIDEARSSDFPRDKNVISAAVMVQLHGGQPLSERTARAIRQMVASSVAGLKPESVAVVDGNNHRTMPGGDSAGGSLDEYADYQERQELEWQQKITHVLEYIPGVLVSTNVELESQLVGQAGGSAGAGQSPPGGPSATRPSLSSGPAIKRVNVSVVVPHSYHESVWRKEQPTPPGKRLYVPEPAELAEVASREKQKIESLVTNLLPAQSSAAEVARHVAVSTYYPPNAPSSPGPAWHEVASAWYERHWGAVTVAGLMLVGLLMLHSTVKSRAAPAAREEDARAPAAPFPLVGDDKAEQDTEQIDLERRARRAPLPIHDELADIVRDDPEAAASILRTWIGNAS